MAQREIIEHLEKNKNKWFDTSVLANIFGVSQGSIQENLRRLSKRKHIVLKKKVYDNSIFKYKNVYKINAREMKT
jgi:transcription initiation factor IIE alpha subunit